MWFDQIYVAHIVCMIVQLAWSQTIWQQYIWVFTNSSMPLIVIVVKQYHGTCEYNEYSKLFDLCVLLFERRKNSKDKIRKVFVCKTFSKLTTRWLCVYLLGVVRDKLTNNWSLKIFVKKPKGD